jgi:hypothetical protein
MLFKNKNSKLEKIQDKELQENPENKITIILFFIDNFFVLYLSPKFFEEWYKIYFSNNTGISFSDFINRHLKVLKNINRNIYIEEMAFAMSHTIKEGKEIGSDSDKNLHIVLNNSISSVCKMKYGNDYSQKYNLTFKKYEQVDETKALSLFINTAKDIIWPLTKKSKEVLIKSKEDELEIELVLSYIMLSMCIYDIIRWVFFLKTRKSNKIYKKILKDDANYLLNKYNFGDEYFNNIRSKSIQNFSSLLNI